MRSYENTSATHGHDSAATAGRFLFAARYSGTGPVLARSQLYHGEFGKNHLSDRTAAFPIEHRSQEYLGYLSPRRHAGGECVNSTEEQQTCRDEGSVTLQRSKAGDGAHARDDHATGQVLSHAMRKRRQGLGHPVSRHEAVRRQHRCCFGKGGTDGPTG
jgi:hypothetical protein